MSQATIPLDTRTLAKQTADQLLAEGFRPTVATIRERMGRGSDTTINAALKEWWLDVSQRLTTRETRPELPSPLLEAAEKLWAAALLQADESFSVYRAEADAKVETAHASVEAAAHAQRQAEACTATIQQQHDTLEQVRLELERRLAAENAHREQAEHQIKKAQAESTRLQRESAERIQELEAQLKLEQERYTEMERHWVKQADEAKIARELVEQALKERTDAWRKQESTFRQQLQDLHKQQAELAGRDAALEEQLQAQKLTLQTLLQEKIEAVTTTATLREQRAVSLETQKSLRAEIAQSQELISLAAEEKKCLQEVLQEREVRLGVLEAEKSNFMQPKRDDDRLT